MMLHWSTWRQVALGTLIMCLCFGTLLSPALPVSAQTAPPQPPVCKSREGEVILMGDADDITAFVAALPPGITLTTARSIIPMYWMTQISPIPYPFTDPGKLNDMEAHLYTFTGPQNVPDAIQQLWALPGADEMIIAPNCLTVGHRRSARGSPFAIVMENTALMQNFFSQAAFQGHPGIGVMSENTRTVEQTSACAAIVVFDSSPFDDVSVGQPLAKTIHIGNYSFPLTVFHSDLPDDIEVIDGDLDLPGHGMMIIGLAHHVAPGSPVVLYQVLNEHAVGDAFTLLSAVSSYMSRNRARPAVFSMSLGIGEDSWLPPNHDPLATTLEAVTRLRKTVVASAGNDGRSSEGEAPAAQMPASYDHVIGVGATTRDGTRACYSNQGDVWAPGGNAKEDGGLQCESVADNDFMIAPYPSQNDPTQMVPVRAAGSSFATPLAAGTAALFMGQAECRGDLSGVAPALLSGTITSDAGYPIVNVEKSLSLTHLESEVLLGWHLVGFPFVTENTPIHQALRPIQGKYDAACAHRPTESNPWSCYMPALAGGELTAIGPMDGLWVHFTSPTILRQWGLYPAQATRALQPGWNIVSIPAPTRPIEEVAASFDGISHRIYRDDGQGTAWATYPSHRLSTAPLAESVPGKAYWVLVGEEGQMVIANPE